MGIKILCYRFRLRYKQQYIYAANTHTSVVLARASHIKRELKGFPSVNILADVYLLKFHNIFM